MVTGFTEYKSLETKVHTGSKTKITFLPGEKIKLSRGMEEDEHIIRIITPWNNTYNLGRYDDETSAKKDFDKFHNFLNRGYQIHIAPDHTVKLIPPST